MSGRVNMSWIGLLLALLLAVGVFAVISCGDDDDDDPSTGSGQATDDDDEEVWTDPESGLTWQNGDDCCYAMEEAVTYCQNLSWGGYDDWRLPSISELRSLIRGCFATETGGACGITDSCLDTSCGSQECVECEFLEGPGLGGEYWPEELSGTEWFYWSSSPVTNMDDYAWYVDFDRGAVDYEYAGMSEDSGNDMARCVRP